MTDTDGGCIAPQPRSSAARRYQRRFWVAMAAYVVLMLGAAWLFKHNPPTGFWKYPAAVAPAVPLVGIIVAMGFYLVEEADEFLRLQTTLAMLWGLGLVLVVTTVWGFLENFAAVAHMPSWWVFLIFLTGMGVAQIAVSRRYR